MVSVCALCGRMASRIPYTYSYIHTHTVNILHQTYSFTLYPDRLILACVRASQKYPVHLIKLHILITLTFSLLHCFLLCPPHPRIAYSILFSSLYRETYTTGFVSHIFYFLMCGRTATLDNTPDKVGNFISLNFSGQSCTSL